MIERFKKVLRRNERLLRVSIGLIAGFFVASAVITFAGVIGPFLGIAVIEALSLGLLLGVAIYVVFIVLMASTHRLLLTTSLFALLLVTMNLMMAWV